MNRDAVKKEGQHSCSTVVIVGLDSNHKASLAINECMNHNLPPNQAYWHLYYSNWQEHMGVDSYRVVHHDATVSLPQQPCTGDGELFSHQMCLELH
jgi:hypothetical protein